MKRKGFILDEEGIDRMTKRGSQVDLLKCIAAFSFIALIELPLIIPQILPHFVPVSKDIPPTVPEIVAIGLIVYGISFVNQRLNLAKFS